MRYQYQCGNEIIRVWIGSYENKLSVETKEKGYYRTIRTDEKGKFFTWNKHKIYLDNWIRTSMKELKQKIDNKEFITDDDLCVAIMSDGVENVRFIVPMNTRSGIFFLNACEFKDVECKIVESWNREVKTGYKFTLVPVEPDDSITNKSEFYVSDFLSLIVSGHIQIVLKENEVN